MTQSLPSTMSARPHSERSGGPLLASERAPVLPGCEPFPMTEDKAAVYEGRIEAWDAHARTAWRVCAPTTIYHEELRSGPRSVCRSRARYADGHGTGVYGRGGLPASHREGARMTPIRVVPHSLSAAPRARCARYSVAP